MACKITTEYQKWISDLLNEYFKVKDRAFLIIILSFKSCLLQAHRVKWRVLCESTTKNRSHHNLRQTITNHCRNKLTINLHFTYSYLKDCKSSVEDHYLTDSKFRDSKKQCHKSTFHYQQTLRLQEQHHKSVFHSNSKL